MLYIHCLKVLIENTKVCKQLINLNIFQEKILKIVNLVIKYLYIFFNIYTVLTFFIDLINLQIILLKINYLANLLSLRYKFQY